jgi:hypothetical protein
VDARQQVFSGEADRRFRFLVERLGFLGPDTSEEDYVGYSAPPWSIWIVLDTRNRTVDTNILFEDDKGTLHIPLFALLTSQGLPAQMAPDSAQTAKGVVRSLGRQADALARILPQLMTVGSREAMLRAGATERPRRA